MSLLNDVFQLPFEFVGSRTFNFPISSHKTTYKTRLITDETTTEEIFIKSKMYLDHLILKYNRYRIDNIATTETSYNLYIIKILDNEEWFEKQIYYASYDNDTNILCNEKKYDDNLEINGQFYICIDIIASFVEDTFPHEPDDEEIYRGTIIRESECVICYENIPNVLFSDCLHMVVCSRCNKVGRIRSCPICRTNLNRVKIKIH